MGSVVHLVTDDTAPLSAQIRAIADLIDGGLDVEHGLIVAVVDGAVSYAPLGRISLIESIGLLELGSRKVERDMLR